MMKSLEETISNLTSSVSNEASCVSSTNRNDNVTTPPPSQLLKRKRNLPGHPDPDAEVIALSPNTLLATNRFVCDICNKGFQRDQNLQLHRRGHNLPWKLKQRCPKEVVRKKVYVCPETTCVHHDPSRALGDLTGVKKHFSRKHGEKKWKCDKCSKKYAVQSDWKAHSKVCGTREYRCDCGTLFSRRDSFVTHRAFCDALAEEGTRKHPIINIPCNNNNNNNIDVQPQFVDSNELFQISIKKEHQNFREIPLWLPPCPPPLPAIGPGGPGPPEQAVDFYAFQQAISTDHPHPNNPSVTPRGPTGTMLPPYTHPHVSSATALLQKAAQMSARAASSSPSPPSPAGAFIARPAHVPALGPSRDGVIINVSSAAAASYGNKAAAAATVTGGGTVTGGAPAGEISSSNNNPSPPPPPSPFLHGFDGPGFEESFKFMEQFSNISSSRTMNNSPIYGDGQTRDFLGLRAFSESEILSMAGFSEYMSSNNISDHGKSLNQHHHHHKSWQG